MYDMKELYEAFSVQEAIELRLVEAENHVHQLRSNIQACIVRNLLLVVYAVEIILQTTDKIVHARGCINIQFLNKERLQAL